MSDYPDYPDHDEGIARRANMNPSIRQLRDDRQLAELEASRDRDNAIAFRIEAADKMRKEILWIISTYEEKYRELKGNEVAAECAETCAHIRRAIALISTLTVIDA